ncbi:hypothetical protein M409DRAFT_24707 [Zasmidium cellare ATCC 36951]|uniref:Uncharacterized protein n=1 Tax=Zasmidium cellare ATCC 36951 TaxID=1080233 RepID=A0A6A6CFU7_ZASCE|nr:uncharacterized protein M409DRAFT_24707 [Zasmidium cellare ATCC 36951]KAF2164802.1 hypothetical protein M409DRAFT_24707 [Zasmidium cellare ATCC 36951]
MVSEYKDNKDHLLKTKSHNAAFNGAFFANKPASAYLPALSVTTACDHARRIIHDQRYSTQDLKRDSSLSIKIPASTLDLSKTIFTMPPTPPQTPRKGSKDTYSQGTTAQRSKIRRWQIFPVVCPDQPLASKLQQIRSQNKIHLKKEAPALKCYQDVRAQIRALYFEGERKLDPDARAFGETLLDIPCTYLSLDHLLVCGQKVVTVKPEPCTSNCHARHPPDFVQIHDLDARYMCMACIVNDLHVPHDAKYRGVTEVVIKAASGPSKPPDWLEKNLDLVAEGYRDEALRELKRSANDKFCISMSWMEPHWQHLVEEIVQEKVQAEELLEKVSRAPCL